MTPPGARHRLVEWEDPASLQDAFRQGGGLVMLGGIVAGALPPAPMAALLGMELIEVAEGRAVMRAEPGEEHQNEIGLVHGGFASALLDNAMGTTVASTMREGDRAAGLGLNVSFLRPLTPGMGRVRAEGRIVRAGSRVLHAEAELIHEPTGELLARATSVFSLLRAEATRQ